MEFILGVITLGSLILLVWREKRHEIAMTELVQRLQAPDQAIREYQVRQGKREPIPQLPYDDDAAFRAVKQQQRETNGQSD